MANLIDQKNALINKQTKIDIIAKGLTVELAAKILDKKLDQHIKVRKIVEER